MKTVNQYLDLIKENYGIKSDYALFKFMGIGKSRLSGWRNGRSSFDTNACLQVADLLEIDPMEVIAAMNATREKTENAQTFWKNTYSRISGHTVGVILSSGTAMAYSVINALAAFESQYYILC